MLFVFPVSFVDISLCLQIFLSLCLSARLIASERLISLECGVDLVFWLTPPPPPVGSWLCVVQLFTGCVVHFFGVGLTNTSDLELLCVCVCVCTQCSLAFILTIIASG